MSDQGFADFELLDPGWFRCLRFLGSTPRCRLQDQRHGAQTCGHLRRPRIRHHGSRTRSVGIRSQHGERRSELSPCGCCERHA